MKRVLPMQLALLLSSAVAVGQDRILPETAAGRVAAAFLAAYGADGEEAMRRYLVEVRSEAALSRKPVDERLAQFRRFRGMLGELSLHSVSESDEHEITLLVSSEVGWMSIRFALDPDPPHKLESFSIRPGAAPRPNVDESPAFSTLAELVDTLRVEEGLPGLAVGVVEADRIHVAVGGVRRSGGEVLIHEDDGWHLGSVTKSMTATVVAALVERGTVSWDTTIADALPHLEVHPAFSSVTLEQVLQHRAGFPAVFEHDEHAASVDPRQAREDLVAAVLETAPSQPAGTWGYSNVGYAVAGHIAEVASDTAWEELMRVHVFRAAGMERAGFGWPATVDCPDQPRGHTGVPPDLIEVRLDEPSLGPALAPAGDAYCSIRGLARYARAHLRGLRGGDTFLSAETVSRLHTPLDASDPGDFEYGAGWMIERRAEGDTHYHGGSAMSFFAYVHLDPTRDRAVVVAMNSGALSNQAVAERVVRAIASRSSALRVPSPPPESQREEGERQGPADREDVEDVQRLPGDRREPEGAAVR